MDGHTFGPGGPFGPGTPISPGKPLKKQKGICFHFTRHASHERSSRTLNRSSVSLCALQDEEDYIDFILAKYTVVLFES